MTDAMQAHQLLFSDDVWHITGTGLAIYYRGSGAGKTSADNRRTFGPTKKRC